MKTVTKFLMLGSLFFSLPACRSSGPPPTTICTGDGAGGGDCTLPDASHQYKSPSDLKNSWIIPDQKQAAAFVSWCYDITPEQAAKYMEKYKADQGQ